MKLNLRIIMVCWLMPLAAFAAPLGSAFNYNGRLTEGGAPATGTYDFQFSIFSVAVGGAALLPALARGDVSVNNGLFTVELDFGSATFAGDERWLEIAVRPGASIGAYTMLTPRQRLNATPYSLYSLRSTAAPWSGLTGVPASFADGVDNNTTYSPGAGLTLAGTTFSVDPAAFDGHYWKLLGNSGTDPLINFLGTTDNQPLHVRVNNVRALRIEPNAFGWPNLIGGYSLNVVDAGLRGATIAGGGGETSFNRVSGNFGFIGGGDQNRAGEYGTVVGGAGNEATGYGSFVGGGAIPPGVAPLGKNFATATASTIGGGTSNTASGVRSSILGGGSNIASGNGSAIGGGAGNFAGADFATVGGGSGNFATGLESTASGGTRNTASGFESVAAGGGTNVVSGPRSVVSGGWANLSIGTNVVISGGHHNTNSGVNSVIGGGAYNRSLAISAVVAGGSSNLAASATNTLRGMAVGGGERNEALGNYATVPGGWSNSASGNYSLAAGRRAKVTHDGSFVWADSTDAEFPSTAPNQFLVRANNGLALVSSGTALEVRSGSVKVTGAGVGTSTPVFIHRATAATISGSITKIEHPLCNADPNAILIVTPNWNPGGGAGVYNNHPIGVFYDNASARWHIFNQDSVAISVNAAFNVMIVKP